MLKLILQNFLKGFGNWGSLTIPYHVKNPYGNTEKSLARDWNVIARDMNKIFKQKEKENAK